MATALSWEPFISIYDCNSFGENCNYHGLLVDLMDFWSKSLNFTWDIYKDTDGDWGSYPKSGPFNLSGEWSGVMGDVVTGKYPFSLVTWAWYYNRDFVSDLNVVVHWNAMVASVEPKSPKLDPKLFFR